LRLKAAFFIAIRYLWARAHEGGRYLRGASLGIAISLVPIIVTLIVADGMINGIIDRYLELGTGHLQIYDLYASVNDETTVEQIREIEGVRGVWPEQKGLGVIAGRNGRTGVTIRSIEPSFWDDEITSSFIEIIDGKHKPQTDRDIVLGEALAKNIGAQTGGTVRIMTLNTDEYERISPRSASFTVSGIVSCGYNELDALWCILTLEGGFRLFSADRYSTGLIVKIDNPYNKTNDFLHEFYSKLGGGYNVYTWRNLLYSQYSSYETTRQLLLFIMALIVIVAAVNVSSATSILVLERQRDIAILKISGSNIKGVTGVFLWGSFLTGLFGSIFGISLGLLIGININILIRSLEKSLSFFSYIFNGTEIRILDPGFYLETIPIIIDWNTVFLIGFFAILCSVLASWIPARKAGKLKPMELLRKT
jgi:lipoprotein-releasing system permease protein